MKKQIEEFKQKANRPYAMDFDVERLINACGGDVDQAVNLIKEMDEERKGAMDTCYKIN